MFPWIKKIVYDKIIKWYILKHFVTVDNRKVKLVVYIK